MLHLNLNFLNAGTHTAAWLFPESDPFAFINPRYYAQVTQIAEKGKFDAIFLADFPVMPGRADLRPFQALEPIALLSHLAAITTHIGLIGTVSSTYNPPFNVARSLSTLDHLSQGRAGINIVTTADAGVAANFGLAQHPTHAQRYQKAEEFGDVLLGLWNSWAPDALTGDKPAKQLVNMAKVQALNHQGEHFQVKGPLTLPRTPQGRPVIVQAGGSAAGTQLAARHADAVFIAAHTIEDALAYEQALTAQLATRQRSRNSVRILPGLVTVIADTEAKAKAREQALWDLAPLEVGLQWLSGLFGIDVGQIDPDAPLPKDLPIPRDGMTTFARNALEKANREQLSIRQLIRLQGAGGTNHRSIVGTPEQVAQDIERWWRTGAIDGFNLMPDVLPSGLQTFVDEVVPLLQKRGIFRTDYDTTTLSGHFGLSA